MAMAFCGAARSRRAGRPSKRPCAPLPRMQGKPAIERVGKAGVLIDDKEVYAA